MSDQEIGKKEVERMDLEPFLKAYEWVTGETIVFVVSAENPDFICERSNGEKVGIELTKLTRDPRDIFWENVLNNKTHMDSYEAQEYIYYLIEIKEKARVKRYASRVPKTILVLQLVDGSLGTIENGFAGRQADFTDHRFCEIWIADYSGLEAFGDIELFGLYPERWWGHHRRLWPHRKPFG